MIDIVLDQLSNLSSCAKTLEAPQLTRYGIQFGFAGKNSEHQMNAEVQRPTQVHGVEIIEAEPDFSGIKLPKQADGIFSKQAGQKISVATADCLPILIAAKSGAMVMAVHAGWRGLFAGICHQAVDQFKKHGFATSDLLVAIGPSICSTHFEVGPEVLTSFLQGPIGLPRAAAMLAVSKGINDRWHLDLSSAAAMSFLGSGALASDISISRVCTFEMDADFFSYRRAKAYEGNNLSWIQCT